MSTGNSPDLSVPPLPAKATSSASGIRPLVLFGLLGLMLLALWYDYKVARPAVEDAYARIGQLNTDINSRGGKKYMTNQDVQNELKRAPIDTFTKNGYMVEVYGWRSGLPTKTHKYYAVYQDGMPFIFLKHYQNVMEMDELKDLVSDAPQEAPSTELIAGSDIGSPGGGGGPKKRKRSEDGSDSGPSNPAAAAAPPPDFAPPLAGSIEAKGPTPAKEEKEPEPDSSAPKASTEE
jgi:hypothetical protein